ncbi:hypothetical protein HK096_004280 [Nowakowskiella sp. JEL0078]|nr:hypothetical protein HK096_004280 [Nowakowskiella sp. JEL0078]
MPHAHIPRTSSFSLAGSALTPQTTWAHSKSEHCAPYISATSLTMDQQASMHFKQENTNNYQTLQKNHTYYPQQQYIKQNRTIYTPSHFAFDLNRKFKQDTRLRTPDPVAYVERTGRDDKISDLYNQPLIERSNNECQQVGRLNSDFRLNPPNIPKATKHLKAELTELSECYIEGLFQCENLSPSLAPAADYQQAPETPPHTPYKPSLPKLSNFIANILTRTRVSSSTLILALFYLNRLKQIHPVCRGSRGSGHRLALAALIAASKYLYDDTFDNKAWSSVSSGLFGVAEVNQMEHEFLYFLKYELFVSEIQWNWFLGEIGKRLDISLTGRLNELTFANKNDCGGWFCSKSIGNKFQEAQESSKTTYTYHHNHPSKYLNINLTNHTIIVQPAERMSLHSNPHSRLSISRTTSTTQLSQPRTCTRTNTANSLGQIQVNVPHQQTDTFSNSIRAVNPFCTPYVFPPTPSLQDIPTNTSSPTSSVNLEPASSPRDTPRATLKTLTPTLHRSLRTAFREAQRLPKERGPKRMHRRSLTVGDVDGLAVGYYSPGRGTRRSNGRVKVVDPVAANEWVIVETTKESPLIGLTGLIRGLWEGFLDAALG